jgi:pimeloyl-ACP methyl ester carboxylesterase
MAPETLYTRCGSINIAYQVVGEGPIDMVLVPGWVTNVDVFWEEPKFARFLRRLASFSRLILFDKRGTGLSDRVTDTPMLEERMEDVQAVMKAAGSTSAALMGYSEGGPMCALFAATYPEKTRALIVIGGYARRTQTADYPIGPDAAEVERFINAIEENWGRPFTIEDRAPSMAQDEQFRAWWSRFLRMSASPSAAVALTRANMEIDVRNILSSVRVPTLLLHTTGDRAVSIDHSRYMAGRIPGAKLIEIEAGDHLPFLDGSDAILDAIEVFLTGAKHVGVTDRVLCTIMFTDIVESTRLIAQRGDRQWRDLLANHDEAVRAELSAFKGREVNTTGDGFVATFDGPARAVQCASAIVDATRQLGIDVRAGVHTGECEVQASKLSGLAFHIASRVSDLAPARAVLVSRTVKDLVAGSGLRFQDFGVHSLKGVPDEWQLYRVV